MSLWWILLLVGVLIVWPLINRSSKPIVPPPQEEEPSAPLVASESTAPVWLEPRAEGLRQPIVELPSVAPIPSGTRCVTQAERGQAHREHFKVAIA
jgi:hypothetical protein